MNFDSFEALKKHGQDHKYNKEYKKVEDSQTIIFCYLIDKDTGKIDMVEVRG